MMKDLLRLFEVAPIDRAVLEGALGLEFDDFEDAVLHEAGAIVTRDAAGFSKASLRIYAPDTLLAALETAEEPHGLAPHT